MVCTILLGAASSFLINRLAGECPGGRACRLSVPDLIAAAVVLALTVAAAALQVVAENAVGAGIRERTHLDDLSVAISGGVIRRTIAEIARGDFSNVKSAVDIMEHLDRRGQAQRPAVGQKK